MEETTPLPPTMTPAELAEVDDPRRPIIERPVLVKNVDQVQNVRALPPRSWLAHQVTIRPGQGPVRLADDVPNRTRLQFVDLDISQFGVAEWRISHSAETCTMSSGISNYPSEIYGRGEVWAAAFFHPEDPEDPIPDDVRESTTFTFSFITEYA